MKIRQYRPADLGAVLSVWEQASDVGHPFLSNSFLQSERENIPAIYLPNGDAWVATNQDDVVGFSVLHGNELGALFVSPEFHGRGFGYALVNKAIELHPVLKVEVFKENEIGNEFYSRYGFSFVREYFHEASGRMMHCLEYRAGT